MHTFQRSADLRYFGQAFEVRVPAPAGEITREWADQVTDAFHNEHKALYGYDFRGDNSQQVEWVNLRVSGIGPITRPELVTIESAEGAAPLEDRARRSTRPVCFDADQGFVDTGVYWREDLREGDQITGPAIIEEFGSTVPVHPGFTVRVDAHGNLIITKEAAK